MASENWQYTISHLSKPWNAKFSILCDVIFPVRLQGKYKIWYNSLLGGKGLIVSSGNNISPIDVRYGIPKLLLKPTCTTYQHITWFLLDLIKCAVTTRAPLMAFILRQTSETQDHSPCQSSTWFFPTDFWWRVARDCRANLEKEKKKKQATSKRGTTRHGTTWPGVHPIEMAPSLDFHD